jgi:hypothetical protein
LAGAAFCLGAFKIFTGFCGLAFNFVGTFFGATFNAFAELLFGVFGGDKFCRVLAATLLTRLALTKFESSKLTLSNSEITLDFTLSISEFELIWDSF